MHAQCDSNESNYSDLITLHGKFKYNGIIHCSYYAVIVSHYLVEDHVIQDDHLNCFVPPSVVPLSSVECPKIQATHCYSLIERS